MTTAEEETFYVLDGRTVRQADEDAHTAFWSREDPGRVGLDFAGEVEISTVFLPRPAVETLLGRPLLFETSLFGPTGFIGVVGRYATWSEASAGHRRIDEELRGGKVH